MSILEVLRIESRISRINGVQHADILLTKKSLPDIDAKLPPNIMSVTSLLLEVFVLFQKRMIRFDALS